MSVREAWSLWHVAGAALLVVAGAVVGTWAAGVMALLLGDCTDAVRELESRGEIDEFVRAQQVARGVQRPAGAEFLQKVLDPLARQRRHAAAARHALLVCQTHDGTSGVFVGHMMPAAGVTRQP